MFFAAIAGGFVALPLSDQLTTTELGTLLEDSGAAAVATAQALPEEIIPEGTITFSAADVAAMLKHPTRLDYALTLPDDPAFMVYTSGTTARSKGVLHAHRSAWGRRPMYQGWYGIGPDDRMLHAGAFNWTFTLGVGLTDPWANGATAIVCTGDKRPELWPGLIAATGATLFAAVPGVYRQILKYARPEPQALGRLRHGLMAGETPPAGLIEDWTSATGRPLYEALGMSEISTYISTGPSVPSSAGNRRQGANRAPRRDTSRRRRRRAASTAKRRSHRRASLRSRPDAAVIGGDPTRKRKSSVANGLSVVTSASSMMTATSRTSADPMS